MSPTLGISREINPQWKRQVASCEEFIKICWSSKQKGQFLAGQGSSFNSSCFASSSSSSPDPVYFSARSVGRSTESHQITSRVFLRWKPVSWICHFPGPTWHEIVGFRPEPVLALEDKTQKAPFTSLFETCHKVTAHFVVGFALLQLSPLQRSNTCCVGRKESITWSCPEDKSDHLWNKNDWMQGNQIRRKQNSPFSWEIISWDMSAPEPRADTLWFRKAELLHSYWVGSSASPERIQAPESRCLRSAVF